MTANTHKPLSLRMQKFFMFITCTLTYIMPRFIMDNVQLIATIKMYETSAAQLGARLNLMSINNFTNLAMIHNLQLFSLCATAFVCRE